MKTTDFKYVCDADNAENVSKWLKERGGIRIWPVADFSNLGKTFTTPFRNEDGSERTESPHWSAPNPGDHITDPKDVGVVVDREVKRFRVKIRRAASGLGFKVTDTGSARIRSEVEKAGVGAFNIFDYSTQEAVIMAPQTITPITEWKKV